MQDLELTAAATRLGDRLHLLGALDRLRRDVDAIGMASAMDRFSQRAMGMLTTEAVRDALDELREPERVRDRYGWSAYGQRGLDRRVRLVVTGGFGRTPRLERNEGTEARVTQPGRDHGPQAMRFIVAGGGVRTGQVIGATNPRGEHPVERVPSPNDLWATVYRHLGIDHDDSILDLSGRPMPILPFGAPIPELLGPAKGRDERAVRP